MRKLITALGIAVQLFASGAVPTVAAERWVAGYSSISAA